MFTLLLISILFACDQVDLSRHFHFKFAKKRLPEDVIPIISANMDTIGTFEMAVALAEVQISFIIYNPRTYKQSHPNLGTRRGGGSG